MESPATVHGGCLCGAVRYEADAPFGSLIHCHCSMCRKQHGAAFATFMGVDGTRFRFTSGADRVRRYRSSVSADRAFCEVCGSSLMFRWLSLPHRVWVAAGTLDEDPGVRPYAHIYAASGAPWFEIADGVPVHPEDVT